MTTKTAIQSFSKKKSLGIILFVATFAIIAIGVTCMRLYDYQQSQRLESVAPPPTFVKLIPAQKGDIINWVYGKGIVRTTRREFLNFDYPGKVAFIDKDLDGQKLREGSRVRGPLPGENFGQLLARLDHREQISGLKTQEVELAQAQEEVKAAQLATEQAENDLQLEKKSFKRSKALFTKGLVSQQTFENIQTSFLNAQIQLKSAKARLKAMELQIQASLVNLNQAKLSLEKSSIFAPFDGVIAYFNISNGDYVNPDSVDNSSEQAMLESTPVVIISDDSYEITLNLPAFDGKLVKRDQAAFVTWGLNSLKSHFSEAASASVSFAEGYVYAVSPMISPGGRTIQIKIRTISKVNELQDGMFATCWIVVEEKKDVILAPANSLIYRRNHPCIFTYDQQTEMVTERKVTLGIEDILQVEVLEGIKENDLLVTEGKQRLMSKMKVQLVSSIKEK